MRNSVKLSNYLFGWYMKKYGFYIFGAALILGLGNLLIFSGPEPQPYSYDVQAIAFRTYDLVVDYSWVEVFFRYGVFALLLCFFLQANSYYTNGKGMYTMLTLPMKRKEVFLGFLFSAMAIVLLYFAVWAVMMVLCYFPITSMYQKEAAKIVVSDGAFQINTTVNNGLFLAFQRSSFLSGSFPVSWIQIVTLTGGMLLSVTAAVAAGLYNQSTFSRILMLIMAGCGISWAFRRSVQIALQQINGGEVNELWNSPLLGALGLILAIIFMAYTIRRMKKRNRI